jgi:hypothetical protein
MIATGHKYSLEPYKGRRTRHTCPQCNKANEFTRYIDTETLQHVAGHVGKCNRESKCGYHYSPGKYFRDNPGLANDSDNWRAIDGSQLKPLIALLPPPPPPVYIPSHFIEQSRRSFANNNLYRFLVKLFGVEEANRLAELYNFGTSKHWRNAGGYSVVFWQIDNQGNARQAKVMAYNPETGKRLKTAEGLEVWKGGAYQPESHRPGAYFAGKAILKDREANLKQCLYGEHLLPLFPSKPVAIVESEKTAIIMAHCYPAAVWLATGGTNGARWTDREVYQVLQGRTVVLYPDLGATADWQERAKILATVCAVSVSNLLIENVPEEDRQKGYDIADYFIKNLIGSQAAPEATAAPPQHEPPQGDTVPGKEEESRTDLPTVQPEASTTTLPPGWQWESFDDGHRVMIGADGIPVAWNYEPQNEREALAVLMAKNPAINDLIGTFNLELDSSSPGWVTADG